ncbi:MAG TPA: hypothetical protein VIL95_06905, partial [Bacillota bacterium]
MSERTYSVFSFVNAEAEIQASLRAYGYRYCEEAGRWVDDVGRTPAEAAHGRAPGEGARYHVMTWGCQMNE